MPSSPVVGLDAIGQLFGRTRWTIRRWIDEEDFPAAWLPNGQWCTSTTLIDQWLLDRAAASITGITLPVDGGWTAQ